MTERRPRGVLALALFFIFGALMSGAAGAAALFPGTSLEFLWRISPPARDGLLQMGRWAVPLMASVSLACAAAAIGLWTDAPWGRRTALAVLAVNIAGDAGNAIFRGELRTLIGVPVASALIAYLCSAPVKAWFRRPRSGAPRTAAR